MAEIASGPSIIR